MKNKFFAHGSSFIYYFFSNEVEVVRLPFKPSKTMKMDMSIHNLFWFVNNDRSSLIKRITIYDDYYFFLFHFHANL